MEGIPNVILLYRTLMVLQMVPINIQVDSSLSFLDFLLLISFFPVYSVFPSSLLSFTMEKLLASELFSTHSVAGNSHFIKLANAHRVFVTKELGPTSPVLSPSFHSNLTGIVSIVDSAFLFFLFIWSPYPHLLVFL